MNRNLNTYLAAGLLLLGAPAFAAPDTGAAAPILSMSQPRGSTFWEDFQTDPANRGWRQSGLPWEKFKGQWQQAAGGNVPSVLVNEGYWESPLIPVSAFGYYRMAFQARAPKGGYCWAYFYDAAGKELIPDDHDAVYPTEAWGTQSLAFRAYPLATHVRLRFAANKAPLEIAGVSLEPISSQEALAWTKSVRGAIPAITYAPPRERGSLLPITASRLKNGGVLRVVMLGDSICNDTSNSLYETQLRKLYPRTHFEVVSSVRGGTLCTWYQKENRVADYVLRFKPDLLIIAGISHSFDAEAIRSVIHQVRAQSRADILVVGDSITPPKEMHDGYLKYSGLPAGVAKDNIEFFPGRLRSMVAVEEVEFLDMRSAWTQYLSASPQPVEWFLRDPIHGNSRAKQVVGTILARYLAFVPAP